MVLKKADAVDEMGDASRQQSRTTTAKSTVKC